MVPSKTVNKDRNTIKQHSFRRASIILIFVGALLQLGSVLSFAGDSIKGLRIYYIRHAEGGHNVKQDWIDAGIPEDEWPEYVGNPDKFTPLGLTQVVKATQKLQNTHFDFIGVSPLWRCRNTVLPYLEEIGDTGEIWPELKELYASSLIISPDLPPPPDDTILGAGSPIVLPLEETPYFILRKDGLNNFKLPDFPDDHSEKEAETAASKVVIQRAIDLILEQFGGSDKSILLVGHGSSGKGILRMLTNDILSGFPGIENTGIWMVEEQPNGKFELKIFNDLPVINGKIISEDGLLPTLEPGNTWYHNYFPFEFNAPIISTFAGKLSTSETTPSIDINPGTLVSKFVRDSATQSYIRFELPEDLTNLGAAIFKVRVYAPSKDSSGDNSLQLVLQKENLAPTRLSLSKEIIEYDKWVEYTFDMSEDSISVDYYNTVYLCFRSSEDNPEGKTYYTDAFQGPKNPYEVTFRVRDQWTGSLLRNISVVAGQREKLTDTNGEVKFSLSQGVQSIRIRHADYLALDSSMQISSDTLVLFSLIPDTKSVSFNIVSEYNNNPLSNITAKVGAYEKTTGIDGKVYFHLYKGQYEYAISHPEYFTTSSSFKVSADTAIQIILKAKRANIKFRIYSESFPLNDVDVEITGDSLETNQTGIAVFENLLRYEEYQWSASKEGFEHNTGTLILTKDTTVNINMNVLNHTEDPGLPGLSLYPNPTYSNFFIESEAIINRIEFCDLRGKLLFGEGVQGKNVSVDVTGFPNGVYITRIFFTRLRPVSLKVMKVGQR